MPGTLTSSVKARTAWLMLALVAAPVMAQRQGEPQAAEMPGSASNVPPEASPKVIDRGGLASRGGTAIRSQTFQETIGTSIYTAIGTQIGTPVQSPRG